MRKYEAGEYDDDARAADTLAGVRGEGRGARAAGRSPGARDRVFKKGREKRTLAERRAHIRDHRPAGISVARGCALMGVARSSCYAVPAGAPDETAIVAEIAGDLRGLSRLWLPPGRRRAAPSRPRGQRQEAAADPARAGPEPPAAAAPGGHHDERPWRPDLPQPRQRLRGARARPALGGGHHLRRHQGGLRLSRRRARRLVAARGRLRARPASRRPPHHRRARGGARRPPAAAGMPVPLRPRRAIQRPSRIARCSPRTASSAR